MLKSLRIKNFAVIEAVELAFGPGFTVFTGETGAGKSIVIEALSFLLGARGTVDWIRAGADRLEVEGVFATRDGELKLRRELDKTGKGRAFLNGAASSAAALAKAADAFVDFHGQHEHQSLLKPAVQLDLLDSFGKLETFREKVAAACAEWSELAARLEASKMSEEERARALDLYKFQAKEIDAAHPHEGEEEELDAMLPRLKDGEKLRALSDDAASTLLNAEGAAASSIAKAERALEELARLDPAMSETLELARQARVAVEEAAYGLETYASSLEADPGKLEELLSRQETLSRLKRKYGGTLAEVVALRQRLEGEIDRLENFEERRGDLEKQAAAAGRGLDKLCEKLHDERMEAARKLGSAVTAQLKGLGMPAVRFSVSVEMEEGRRGPTGADSVEFLIAPNPGEPLKPLKSVASGGELSRTMLGLKTILAAQDRVPVLVFDEVDAGVGGAVAHAVGKNLAALAAKRQVLCVTHLPQVASYANGHFSIAKEVAKGRTSTKVTSLVKDSRLEESARMLSGRETSKAALKAAEELLESAS